MSGTGPTTDEELSADLKRLFRQAQDNGIDVRGGWECRNGRGAPDLDLVVTEVEKRAGSETTDTGPLADGPEPVDRR